MKKLAGILLILIYSISVSGFSLQFNYCCNKITIQCCKPAVKKNCCNSKKEKKCICVVREIPATEFETKSFVVNNIVTTLPQNKFAPKYHNHFQPQFAYEEVADDSPPLSPSPLYLLYNVFRI